MEFRLLGPLEVSDGAGLLPLGGPRQRLALAVLVLEANRVVPADQLIDLIWGEEPPDTARATLSAYVSRLRRLLGEERVQARPPGYVLIAARDEVDVFRFTDRVEAARRETVDAAKAAALLTEALDLWRGGAIADLAHLDAVRPAITRLEEHRLAALEQWIDVELGLGRHREAVAILEGLTRDHPLRERLWAQRMLALYRSGRQGDALGAFHQARTTLAEELGIDPSPELRRLHEQVLQQDPGLDLPATPDEVSTTPSAGGPDPVATGPARGPAAAAAPDPATSQAVVPMVRAVRAPARAARRTTRLALVAGLAALVPIAGLAAGWLAAQGPALPRATWTIGLDMPLSGRDSGLGQPVRNAVMMAVDDLNAAGTLDGTTIQLSVLDDAGDPATAGANARTFAGDPSVVAMIGPWGSAAAFEALPITNEAGLLECSPASSYPGLTKPGFGALELRAARPDAINFVRLAPSDDIQAIALASFAFRDLGAQVALVVDDTGPGSEIADAFDAAFAEIGGLVVRRSLDPSADARAILAPLADELNPPGVVFFGGELEAGAALRRAMARAGRLATPFLSWDALLLDATGITRAYIDHVGAAAAEGTYAAHASLPDHRFDFADAYRQRFGTDPDEYAAAGYACVEIIADALRRVASGRPSVAEVRGQVRAFAVADGHRYETVLGTVGFDANGDALQQFVTFYRADASAADGAGDWLFVKKQDFGPAP